MTSNRLINVIADAAVGLSLSVAIACTVSTTASKPSENSRVQRIADVPAGALRYKLFFISKLEGWLASGKKLWRSSDGGKTWELAYSGEGSWDVLDSIDSLEFINSQTGWMLVDRIYRTEDGGNTWIRLSDPDVVLHSIHLLEDGKLGWAAGEMYRPISPKDAGVRSQLVSSDGKKVLYPALFHTEDGGNTWSLQSLPSSEGRLLHLYFLDADHGWAASDAEFFYLEDGRWRRADYSTGQCAKRLLLEANNPHNVVYPPAAIYFLDANQGWLSFQNGYMAKTTDGGRTWCDLLNPRDVFPVASWDTYFTKVHFADPMQGWGLGANGSLYNTNDGGASWKLLDKDLNFYDVQFLADGAGFAVARDGLYRVAP